MRSRRSRFPYPVTTWRRTCVLISAAIGVALATEQSALAATSPAPIVTTGTAVYNAGSDSATVEGTVNSNAEAATYRFDYGTATNYTSQTISEPIGTTVPELVDAALTGLSTNAVYHYRIEATDAWGTSYGADQTFTTGTGASGGPFPFASFTATAWLMHNKCGFFGIFNASASLPAAGTSITQYAWSFGDGSRAVSTSPQAFHSYHAGAYHVVLTVTETNGTSASASRTISGGSGSPYCS